MTFSKSLEVLVDIDKSLLEDTSAEDTIKVFKSDLFYSAEVTKLTLDNFQGLISKKLNIYRTYLSSAILFFTIKAVMMLMEIS